MDGTHSPTNHAPSLWSINHMVTEKISDIKASKSIIISVLLRFLSMIKIDFTQETKLTGFVQLRIALFQKDFDFCKGRLKSLTDLKVLFVSFFSGEKAEK